MRFSFLRISSAATTAADASPSHQEAAPADPWKATRRLAPDYPGAQLISVTTGVVTEGPSFELSTRTGAKFKLGGVSRTHAETFTTPDTPQEVMWFYKSAAQGARLYTTQDAFGADGKRTFQASRGQDHLTVEAAVEGGGSRVTVSYSVAGRGRP